MCSKHHSTAKYHKKRGIPLLSGSLQYHKGVKGLKHFISSRFIIIPLPLTLKTVEHQEKI
jgi:ribosomal protein S18